MIESADTPRIRPDPAAPVSLAPAASWASGPPDALSSVDDDPVVRVPVGAELGSAAFVEVDGALAAVDAEVTKTEVLPDDAGVVLVVFPALLPQAAATIAAATIIVMVIPRLPVRARRKQSLDCISSPMLNRTDSTFTSTEQ